MQREVQDNCCRCVGTGCKGAWVPLSEARSGAHPDGAVVAVVGALARLCLYIGLPAMYRRSKLSYDAHVCKESELLWRLKCCYCCSIIKGQVHFITLCTKPHTMPVRGPYPSCPHLHAPLQVCYRPPAGARGMDYGPGQPPKDNFCGPNSMTHKQHHRKRSLPTAPVVLVDKDEEAALRGVNERAQALVCGSVPVPHLLQHHAAHYDVVDRGMLQQVHLANRRACMHPGTCEHSAHVACVTSLIKICISIHAFGKHVSPMRTFQCHIACVTPPTIRCTSMLNCVTPRMQSLLRHNKCGIVTGVTLPDVTLELHMHGRNSPCNA